MNDLEIYFNNNQKRVLWKYPHFLKIYDQHFSKYKNKDVCLLEIGSSHGGCLQMWKSYFGVKAKIYGIDVRDDCKTVVEDRIEVFIGSQSDLKFLDFLKKTIPKLDIIIDDGSHEVTDQVLTFEKLFPHLDKDGVYACEDVHTSYRPNYGGGYKKVDTFIEHCKNLVDQLHARTAPTEEDVPITDFSNVGESIHFYENLVIIEKSTVPRTDAKPSGKVWLK